MKQTFSWQKIKNCVHKNVAKSVFEKNVQKTIVWFIVQKINKKLRGRQQKYTKLLSLKKHQKIVTFISLKKRFLLQCGFSSQNSKDF